MYSMYSILEFEHGQREETHMETNFYIEKEHIIGTS